LEAKLFSGTHKIFARGGGNELRFSYRTQKTRRKGIIIESRLCVQKTKHREKIKYLVCAAIAAFDVPEEFFSNNLMICNF